MACARRRRSPSGDWACATASTDRAAAAAARIRETPGIWRLYGAIGCYLLSGAAGAALTTFPGTAPAGGRQMIRTVLSTSAAARLAAAARFLSDFPPGSPVLIVGA